MIRIYEKGEIPKGYKDTISMNNIKLHEVKYILDSDGERCWIIAEKLGKYQLLGTITDGYIYVIFE